MFKGTVLPGNCTVLQQYPVSGGPHVGRSGLQPSRASRVAIPLWRSKSRGERVQHTRACEPCFSSLWWRHFLLSLQPVPSERLNYLPALTVAWVVLPGCPNPAQRPSSAPSLPAFRSAPEDERATAGTLLVSRPKN